METTMNRKGLATNVVSALIIVSLLFNNAMSG